MDEYSGIINIYGAIIGLILLIYHHCRPAKQPYYEYSQKMLIITELLLIVNALISYNNTAESRMILMITAGICCFFMTFLYCRFIHLVIWNNNGFGSRRKYWLIITLVMLRTGVCLVNCITPVFYDIHLKIVTDRIICNSVMALSIIIEVLLAVCLVGNRRLFTDGDYLTLLVILMFPVISGSVHKNTDMVIMPTLMLVTMLISEMRMSINAMKKEENSIRQLQTRVTLGQLKPHYIINVLTTVYYMINKGDKGKEVLLKFIGFLRNGLKNSENTEVIDFEKEMDVVKDYISIEGYRYKNITVKYQLESTDFKVYPFTVQTLVENSIRHGIGNRQGSIVIRSWNEDDSHFVQVIDDGVGFDENMTADSDQPSALRYIKNLLKTNAVGELRIERENDLTVITMKLNRQDQ